MPSRTPRRLILACAATLALGPSLVAVAPAQAASTAHTCPSQRTVANALTKNHRKHLVRSSYNRNGVRGIRCSGRWSAAIASYNFGGVDNAYPVLEHRSHGRWHELDRDRPCRLRRVPAKIYAYACEGS